MNAIRLEPSQKEHAARVWARSFFDYPLMTFCRPDARGRARCLERCFGWTISYGLRYGEVYTTADLAGLAIWLPPGRTRVAPWRCLMSGFPLIPSLVGLGPFFTQMARNERSAQRAHRETVPGPHWYLWALAVDPDRQGQGIGTVLIRPGLEKADAACLPCYLETHNQKSIPFYAKHGFETAGTEQVPGTDMRFWYFVRKPCVHGGKETGEHRE